MEAICRYTDRLVSYSSFPEREGEEGSGKGRPESIPYLPAEYILHEATRVVLREARAEESARFYDIYQQGGYGVDEFPTHVGGYRDLLVIICTIG